MTPTDELKDIRRTFRHEEGSAINQLKALVRPGMTVRWDHNGHMQSGEVIGVYGAQFHILSASIVNARTGRRVSIYANRILEVV